MRLFYPHDFNPQDIPHWQTQIAAILCVLVAFMLCVGSPRLGTRTAVILTVIKVSRNSIECI